MTSLQSLIGNKVVSRASAEHVGDIHDVVLQVPGSRIVAWQIGRGRKARFVEQANLTGAGGAAIVIDDEANLYDARDEVESATAKGRRSPLGHLTLTDTGDELGTVTDLDVDPATGDVLSAIVGDHQISGDRLLGFGSYALVVAAQQAAH